MFQENHETAALPAPLWLTPMKNILDDIDAGNRPRNLAAVDIYASCNESILAGEVPDLGQLFNYLWARDSPVIPIARLFTPIEKSSLICVDHATNKPRKYGVVFQLADQATKTLSEKGMTAPEYANILTHETGSLRYDQATQAGKIKRTTKIISYLRRLIV